MGDLGQPIQIETQPGAVADPTDRQNPCAIVAGLREGVELDCNTAGGMCGQSSSSDKAHQGAEADLEIALREALRGRPEGDDGEPDPLRREREAESSDLSGRSVPSSCPWINWTNHSASQA